ncbi:MAG: hypothetical protein EXS03_00295 [Phycisphaerales bacterium]|nr:hypothetical protein [Phycisphaerales bacterium]
MPKESPQSINLKRMQDSAGPYPIEAFEFVRQGLGHTADRVHGDHGGEDGAQQPSAGALAGMDRHVTGQQLCLGLLEFALDRYGMLAPAVMERWNVQRTEDFGRIVFALIEVGLLHGTPTDRPEDFLGVYDFAEVFSPDAMRRRVLAVKG